MNEELLAAAQQYLDGCITALEFRNLFITKLCDIESESELTKLAEVINAPLTHDE